MERTQLRPHPLLTPQRAGTTFPSARLMSQGLWPRTRVGTVTLQTACLGARTARLQRRQSRRARVEVTQRASLSPPRRLRWPDCGGLLSSSPHVPVTLSGDKGRTPSVEVRPEGPDGTSWEEDIPCCCGGQWRARDTEALHSRLPVRVGPACGTDGAQKCTEVTGPAQPPNAPCWSHEPDPPRGPQPSRSRCCRPPSSHSCSKGPRAGHPSHSRLLNRPDDTHQGDRRTRGTCHVATSGGTEGGALTTPARRTGVASPTPQPSHGHAGSGCRSQGCLDSKPMSSRVSTPRHQRPGWAPGRHCQCGHGPRLSGQSHPALERTLVPAQSPGSQSVHHIGPTGHQPSPTVRTRAVPAPPVPPYRTLTRCPILKRRGPHLAPLSLLGTLITRHLERPRNKSPPPGVPVPA